MTPDMTKLEEELGRVLRNINACGDDTAAKVNILRGLYTRGAMNMLAGLHGQLGENLRVMSQQAQPPIKPGPRILRPNGRPV